MSGAGFFVIQDGTASVTIGKKKSGDARAGRLLRRGRADRRASSPGTVTAETPLDCLDISFWTFWRFAKANPDVMWSLLQRMVELLDEAESACPPRALTFRPTPQLA